MPKNIFRVFNPNAPPEDRTEKRRAQLRTAQQTYRERKDRYTKALEQELALSRAREAHLTQENARLRETIQALKHSHGHGSSGSNGSNGNGINADGIELYSEEIAAFDFDLNINDITGINDITADLDWPDFATISNSLCSTPQITHVTEALDASLSSSASPSNSSASCCIGDVDPTDIGMQFILKLEEPCIGHMHTPAKVYEESNVSNNHSLTVTSRLADMHSKKDSTSSSHSKETRAIMQSMLALSKDLVLTHSGALTPVQAWQAICAQPQFEAVPVRAVQALGHALRELVQCHGFGAVIEQRLFTEQVALALAV